jgi:predicted RNase H-like HicB family nuclease
MATRKYVVVIEKAKRNYSAYVPDLPGYVSTGRTVEETQRNIAAAIDFRLRGMAKDGDPMPDEPGSSVAVVAVPFDPAAWKAPAKSVARRRASAIASTAPPRLVTKPGQSRNR